ncbi:MAG: hypothetical protein EP329_01240 [Deltaproteobacteria bacterium]|nr:MAG: hypothetical protein EP329_01240 [Deltaproteobacteria bacterium]
MLCDLWCPYGYQRDPWGCEICACLPPKPCCDPTDEPGPHGASSCTEGATCCADGAWHCNADSGAPACDVPGPVCPDGPCCHAWAEPDCVFPVCCANGQWRCGSASGVSPCDAPGERCEVACPPVACTLFCEHGFAHGDDGCPICACAQPGAP